MKKTDFTFSSYLPYGCTTTATTTNRTTFTGKNKKSIENNSIMSLASTATSGLALQNINRTFPRNDEGDMDTMFSNQKQNEYTQNSANSRQKHNNSALTIYNDYNLNSNG